MLLLLAACQSKSAYETPTPNRLGALLSSSAKNAESGGKHRVKCIPEAALLAYYAGNFKEAAEYFDSAFTEVEGLYTRSLSELGLSKILNESLKTFRPHYLEKWHWMLVAALNRNDAGDLEGALVDIRRLSRDIRLSEDPFGEKRLPKATQHYLSITGILFTVLGRNEEGFSDLRAAWELGADTLPRDIKALFLTLARKRGLELSEETFELSDGLTSFLNGKGVTVTLIGQGPKKEERKLSVTMMGFWPVVHGYLQESSSEKVQQEEIKGWMLGAAGKRLLSISYPVFVSPNPSGEVNDKGMLLDFDALLKESWDLQKNRLIAQSLLRLFFKLVASEKVSSFIAQNVGGDWGALLGNVGRMLVWETERADVRQVLYLPACVSLTWLEEEKGIKVERKSLF